MKIHLDIRDNISPEVALECVRAVVSEGRISNDCKSYCYITEFHVSDGNICVVTRPNRKSDCFLIFKEKER